MKYAHSQRNTSTKNRRSRSRSEVPRENWSALRRALADRKRRRRQARRLAEVEAGGWL